MTGSSELSRALIENNRDAVFLVSPESKIMYASASAEKVLGYQPDEIIDRNGLELVHPQDRDHSGRTLQEVLARPRFPLQSRARLKRRDGGWCWMENTACNLLDEPDVRAILITAREIDTIEATEAESRRQNQELVRSNDELQAFAHTIAHDLKEPLRMISQFTALLVRKAQSDDDTKQMAGFIVNGVARMSALLDDLLASAKYGHIGTPQCVALEDAVQQALENLRPSIAANAANITVGSLPRVLATESELVRLFQNLIGNAIKYRSEAPLEISISAEGFGRDAIIKVKDNGLGIAVEHRQRVFRLFERVNPQDVPGTGIGLAVCKKIVEGLGGSIWVESKPGAGATFCLTLTPAIDSAKIGAISNISQRPLKYIAKGA